MNQISSSDIISSHSPQKHVRRFGFAFQGIIHVILNEANFRVHLLTACFVSILAYVLRFSTSEWAILLVTIGLVLASEMVNSAMEELTDHLVKEHHEGVRIVKDVAAGSVLISAIISVIIGIILFVPKITPILYNVK